MNPAAVRVYAEALLAVSEERGETERTEEAIEEVLAAARQAPELLRALDFPGYSPEARAGIVQEVFGDRLPPLVLNLLDLLGRRRRIRLLPDIHRLYSRLAARCCGLLPAEVTTAVPLEQDQADALAAALRGLLGRSVRLDLKVDPSIVAGAIVSVAGTRYDASAGGRLESIRRAMTEAWRREGGAGVRS